MSMESAHDPRTDLVRSKYFNLYPQPLERWLWQQGLPQAAERVFWLHWREGRRNGNWCSEVPIKRVALECCVDVSTVTRAYQVLKAKGLLRREDPGRDPKNPFCQATAITEVRLPREFITAMAQSPNRRDSGRPVAAPAAPGVPAHAGGPAPSATAAPTTPADVETSARTRLTREASLALWSRVSPAERSRFFAASRDRLTTLEFDADTRLSPEDRGEVLAQLAQVSSARPTPSAVPTAPTPSAYTGPRRLSVLELAGLRRRIVETVPDRVAPEILRQVTWAVEHGALRRFEVPMALNIAVKKLREGAWSKPHRMPPNWLPGAERGRARPETCSAA